MSGGSTAASMAGTSDATFRFQVIGSFAAWRDGQRVADRDVGSRKGRTLLKVLLLHPDQPVTADQLRDALWGDAPPANAERNVASLVSRLRSLLGTDAIEGGAGTYRLRTGSDIAIDLVEAERLAGEARARLAAAEPALAWTAARRALELVGTGTVLGDEPDAEWAEPARVAVTTLRRDLRRVGWEATLALGDPDAAVRLADATLEADPLDEEACRALMRAHQQRGEVAEGLRAYERLRATLAEELGADPSPRTQAMHTALLRDEVGDAPPPAARDASAGGIHPSARTAGDGRGFVGRDAELARLEHAWESATTGRPRLLLIVGEAGIGKTRLAERLVATAEGTGGFALRARCYEAERSLFLGPIVDVLTSLVGRTPPDRLRAALQPWGGALVDLVPDLATLVGPYHRERSSPEVERRRTFQATSTLLRQLAAHQPLLVFLDDLHHAGAATVELLHYLVRHTADSPLLLVATVRVEEGQDTLRELADVAERLELGPLPDAAVTALAAQAGASRSASRILSMTRGHTLSVVETLQALAEAADDVAEPPVPASLRTAVLQRVERAGSEVAELLRGTATLGSTFELPVAADLLDLPIEEVVRRAERAVEARLLVEDGPRLAFSNDLIQEIVYRATPVPTRTARHARAATLLADQPEAVAHHASAAGDWGRALEAWLEAAARAARRYANRDAEQLLTRALAAGEAAGDAVGLTRARLARADVREVLADFGGALEDLEAAAELARANARPDLEAAALRALGGDVIVGLGRPSTDCLPYLEVGLDVAEAASLGDLEVELLGRIAVVWSNRARFDLAADAAERALARARELRDERSVALALDAVKNVSAYTGDLDRLHAVLPELEGILRPAGDLALLQWCVFESVMPALAHARWDTAGLVLERALALNRRTGHPWGSLFLAQRSWLRRARGEYGRAIEDARTAGEADVSAGHPWWIAFADAMLGWVLSDAGAQEDAIGQLQRGAASAERDGMETYLIRCVSHLALAHWRHGDAAEAERHLVRAEQLLAGVRTPPGRAFLHGAHAYAAVARLRLARGEVAAALRWLEQVRGPAETVGWREVLATDRLLRGRGNLLTGEHTAAGALLEEGRDLAETAGLVPLGWEARTALAHHAAATGDDPAAAEHAAQADRHLDVLVASVADAGLRDRLRESAARRREVASGEPLG